MAEIVVGVPVFAQFVESLIFDAPAFIAEENEGAGRNLGGREGCNPEPLGDQFSIVPFVGNALALGGRLDALDDADRLGV